MPVNTKTLLIILMSAFSCKKSGFFAKIVPLVKEIVWKLCREFFSSLSVFCKITINKKVGFTGYASWIWILHCCKYVVTWKNGNEIKIFQHDAIVDFLFFYFFIFFFDAFYLLLSILLTGPSFASISSLILELWQFPFIRDWLETPK